MPSKSIILIMRNKSAPYSSRLPGSASVLAFVQKDQVCSVFFFILTIEMSQNVVIMYVLISFLMFQIQYCIIVRLCTSDI